MFLIEYTRRRGNFIVNRRACVDHLLSEYEQLFARIAATSAELKTQLREALEGRMKAEA